MSDNLPLVSILIPTYNQTKYFGRTLTSAVKQTYPNIEIIICDDSDNNEVEKMVKNYMKYYKNIKYYNNGGPLGQRGVLNGIKCFGLSNGQYINYLFHDDVFRLNKIELMVNYFINNKDVTLVTSYRDIIGKYDEPVYTREKFLKKTSKIDGESLGLFMLSTMANIIGEPTTVMFRKSDIDDEIFDYKGRKIRSYVDMAIWFKLLAKGNAIYISKPLSSFRIHENQNTHKPIIQLWGAVDCYYFIVNSYLSKEFIKSKGEYVKLIEKWLNFYMPKIKEIKHYLPKNHEEVKELKELKEELCKCYIGAIESLPEL